jgi:hypothetical protein
MMPLYRARIEGLGRGDLVKVDCAACDHVSLLTPAFLLRLGLSPQAKVLGLEERFGCRGCGARGRAVVSVKWRRRCEPVLPLSPRWNRNTATALILQSFSAASSATRSATAAATLSVGATAAEPGKKRRRGLGGPCATPLPFGLGPARPARSNPIHALGQQDDSRPNERARPRMLDRAALSLRPPIAQRQGAFVARGRRARPSAAVPNAECRTGQQTKGPSFITRVSRLQFLFPLNDSPAPATHRGVRQPGDNWQCSPWQAGPNYQYITVDLFPGPLINIGARRNCAVGWRGGKCRGLDENGLRYGRGTGMGGEGGIHPVNSRLSA